MLCPPKRGWVQFRLRVIAFNVQTLSTVALTSMTSYVQICTNNNLPNDLSTPSPLLAGCVLVGRMYERECDRCIRQIIFRVFANYCDLRIYNHNYRVICWYQNVCLLIYNCQVNFVLCHMLTL